MKLTCYALDTIQTQMVPGRTDRDWMDAFDARHPYRCLPLVMANTTGWELLSPCSFTATWNGGPFASDIRIDADDDFADLGRLVSSHFSRGVLTFHTGYLFRTEPGWDLWCGGPPNALKDGIQPLTGIVETDWLPFPFTMNWHFTRPGIVSFQRGEPFCFIMPIPHASVDQFEPIIKELSDDPELAAEYEAWSESRGSFLQKLEAQDPDAIREGWQRHYFKGHKPTADAPVDTHINRRRLKRPRRARPGE